MRPEHSGLAWGLLYTFFIASTLCSQTLAREQYCVTTIRGLGGTAPDAADDSGAIMAALSSGCIVDGEGLAYNLTRTLNIPSRSTLRHAILRGALAPGDTNYVVSVENGQDVSLEDVRIDRGDDPFFGQTPGDDPYPKHLRSAAFIAKGSSNLRLQDLEVYGDGVGTGIKIVNSTRVDIVRAKVHDIHWKSYAPPANEIVVGIWLIRSSDIRIEGARVFNLLPSAIIYPDGHPRAGQRNNMTDGIASSGSSAFEINGAEVYNVGEAFDFSGSDASVDYVIKESYAHDVDSFCYKSMHTTNGAVVDSIAERCGLGGFVYAHKVNGLKLLGNVAKDIGSNRFWSSYNIEGFLLDDARGSTPSNVILRDNLAQDSQAQHTMKFGFRNSSAPDQKICFERNMSIGHVMKDFRGFPSACNIP